MTTFVLCSVLVGVADFLIALESGRKKTKIGYRLCACVFMAGWVDLFYMASVLAESYFYMSLWSSLCFICIDIMLFYLLIYVRQLVKRKKANPIPYRMAAAYIGVDAVILLVNPFHEIALTYRYQAKELAHWAYTPGLLYSMHLVFCYLLLLVTFLMLFGKALRIPAVYRNHYLSILWSALIVVFLNAIFLFSPLECGFDISIWFYSLLGLLLYWNAFHYKERGMLNKTREMILEQLGHPIVLFDFENRLVTSNQDMQRMLQKNGLAEQNLELQEFIRQFEFEDNIKDYDRDTSFQYMSDTGKEKISYRCDYQLLKDAKKRVIGRLFIFSDISLGTDLLTGFHTKTAFRRDFEMREEIQRERMRTPICVIICDINRLSLLNDMLGTAMGDKALQKQSEIMRKIFPADSYFARLNDASLMAVCPGTSYDRGRHMMILVAEQLRECQEFSLPLDLEYAFCMADETKMDIVAAADTAYESMRAKKMMNSRSAHSSLMDSLTQALMESDGGTEAHVQRTCGMGEELGRLLALSDMEQSHLKLLCLLHDVGKIGIPMEILHKPGKLSQEEWVLMKTHADKGYRIAKASPELKDIAELILHHHESWNGGGYPDGLEGETIPLLSRVIAVVDAYDAMTHDRPYRLSIGENAAREELRRCSGTQFDPRIVEIFLGMLETMEKSGQTE